MKISVIIPTLNEKETLLGTLSILRDSRPLEIVVVDGGSVDGTVEAAGRLADRVIQGRRGRGLQMHLGAQAASGDLFLFLHADTTLPKGWRTLLEGAWSSSKKPAATAFRLGFDHPAMFYRLVERMAQWRSAWTGVPHGDQAIAIDRETYFKAGGFEDVPLMEEYHFFRELKRFGRAQILPSAVATSARRYEHNGRLRNVLRNQLIFSLYFLGVSPTALAKLYR